MLTAMTEDVWTIVLQVLRAVRSRRGYKVRETVSFWRRCIILLFTTTWRPSAEFCH